MFSSAAGVMPVVHYSTKQFLWTRVAASEELRQGLAIDLFAINSSRPKNVS
jgi:hypothetical protein